MNVFLFGGKDRLSATSKIVKDNEKAEVDETYSFDYKEGILVIAYPNQDKETELEFEYWVGAYEEPGFFSFSGDDGIMNLIIFSVACLFVIIILIVGICCIVKRKKNKDSNKVEKFEAPV